MIASTQIVLSAINAGCKLGGDIRQALIANVAEQPLNLPIGELQGSITEARAQEFFDDLSDDDDLIKLGGPFHGIRECSAEELCAAYRIIAKIDAERIPGLCGRDVVLSFHAIKKVKLENRGGAGFILSSLVETGIELVSANPSALGLNKDSALYQVVDSFLEGVGEHQFGENPDAGIIRNVLIAAFSTLKENDSILADSQRVKVLLGGVTTALLADLPEPGNDVGEHDRRTNLARRLASSALRGGVMAFAEHSDLLVGDDRASKQLVSSVVSQFLRGLEGQDELFSAASINLLFQKALATASENPEVFSERGEIQKLISGTAAVLASAQGHSVFTKETLGTVLHESFDVLAENASTLLGDGRGTQLLAKAVETVAEGLNAKSPVKLLSKHQRMELLKIVMTEVAQHPQTLISANEPSVAKSAAAQIVSSVAEALGKDPARYTNGKNFVELVRIATIATVTNRDNLLDLRDSLPQSNALYSMINAVTTAIDEAGNPRGIVTPDVLTGMIQEVVTVASAKTEAVESGVIQSTVEQILKVAGKERATSVHGGNLPRITRLVLAEVLWRNVAPQNRSRIMVAVDRAIESEFLLPTQSPTFVS